MKYNTTLNIAGDNPLLPILQHTLSKKHLLTLMLLLLSSLHPVPEYNHNSKFISRKNTLPCRSEECGSADLLDSHFLCKKMLPPSSSPPFFLHGPFVQSAEVCVPLLNFAERVILKYVLHICHISNRLCDFRCQYICNKYNVI